MSSPSKITEQPKDQLIPLNNFSSENPLEDSQSIKEKLKGKKVIGMGEATHSSKEFNQLRKQFFQFLVKELDYRIFAWEASFGETLEINNYVFNGEGTAEDALNSVSSPNCKTSEVLDLIEWIRKYNKQVSEEEKVMFYGFDMQNDIASFKKLREMIQKVNNDFIEENKEILEFIEQGKMIYAEIGEEKEAELVEFIKDLENQVEQNKDRYLETISYAYYELLRQLVEILRQSKKFSLAVNENADSDIDSWAFRDQSMAENISWMMDFEDKENAFVWAHNAHVKKGGKPENPESKALGYYLNQKYGKAYYAIGFDFGTGDFKYMDMEEPEPEWEGKQSFNEIHENTLAEKLDKIQRPIFVDFSRISGELREFFEQQHSIHSVGTYFHFEKIEDHYDSLGLSENFDALIFLPEVTASEPLSS